jgi:nitrite reductase (cytochrome c-552)
MEKLRKEKEVFKQNVLPKWIEEAKEREANWGDKVQL